ncbi:MAG: phospho-sugar mutase [Chlamydiota bacterium]|nr:phospho-sugar mutase [Chlamydiota bacterium]
MTTFDSDTSKNLKDWLEGNYDKQTKETINSLLKKNPSEVIDAFYKRLSFGTSGLRGIMGVGTNRINQYTIRAATQGFANHILKQKKTDRLHSVIIGYDSRKNSRYFAEESAKVLAGNEIQVYLFEDLRPTPLVSFGCRLKKCSGGIVITASHNPPEYNGYKVYWSDGAQVLPPHDQAIIDEVEKITDISKIRVVEDINHSLITIVNSDIEEAYYDALEQQQHFPEINRKYGDQLSIVYSSLHGSGITMVPEALHRWGFNNISLVEEQCEPNGAFPTVSYPNPEEENALRLGIDKMLEIDGDILLATDPDTDRVGTAVRHQGKTVLITGNQIACLCLEHICSALHSQNRLPENSAFIKTVVTSELFKVIAEHYGKPCFDVLTGFKYIAEMIDQWEKDKRNGYQYIFGSEESYGYLLGTHSRDKDAVSSCALIAEVALHAKLNGKTLIDLLYDLYEKYGVYVEKLHNLKYEETKEGHEKMRKGIQHLQENPPKFLAGVPVKEIDDYHKSIKINVVSGETEKIMLPKTNLMGFWLEDGSKVMVRPSGTEPKIKIYCGVKKQNPSDSLEDTVVICEEYCANLINDMIQILS